MAYDSSKYIYVILMEFDERLGSGTPSQPLAISGTPPAGKQSNYYRFQPTTTGGAGGNTYALSGAALPAGMSFSTATGLLDGTPTGSGTVSSLMITATDSSGKTASLGPFSIAIAAQATRAFTFADAPITPTLWADAQDAATMTVDSNGRVTAWSSKGSSTGSGFTAADVNHAPLYQATGFNGELPALKFTMTRSDLLTSAFQGPSQPCTVIHVWQEPASGQNPYCCVADYRSSGGADGGRASIFNFYNGTTAMSVFTTSGGAGRNAFANAYNQINVMVLEFNSTNSRVYLNGVVSPLTDIDASNIFGAGMTIGGKGGGDTYTSFNGVKGEVVVFPGVFTGDDWDKVTQGLMWKWRRQASIAAGATYKSAAPTARLAASGAPADGFIGYDYAFTPKVRATTGAITASLTGGTLPPGLTLDASTGKISGKASTAGAYSGIVITIADTISSVTLGPFTINVAAAPALFSFGNPNVSWGDSNLSFGR